MKLMVWRRTATLLLLFCSLLFCSLISPQAGRAQALGDQATDIGWPRQIQQDGNTITIYQPQVERWDGNQLQSRAAVAVETPASAQPTYGVIWLSARTEVDKDRRLVTLEECTITKGTFPTATQDYLGLLRQTIPPGPHTIALDRLQANLAVTQAEQQAQTQPLKNDPPHLFFSPTPALLVLIDGPPALRQVAGTDLLRVINTRALLLADASSNTYYLALMDGWAQAPAVGGPWSLATQPPAGLDSIKAAAVASNQNQAIGNEKQSLAEAHEDGEAPTVYVSIAPTELLLIRGTTTYASMPGTNLTYVQNSADDIFVDGATQQTYVLLGGRWFTAPSLQNGPWRFVAAASLPADFAKIPAYSPKADVLVSVPGTPQAKEAVIANQIPQTATISRTAARATVKYGGAPDFQPIDATPLRYAVNSITPVVAAGGSYYACQTGVWFLSTSPSGPWTVAMSVPPEIYEIPASSPIHYVTYVKVYGYTTSSVYVAYTPGYYGTVLAPDGLVVYGTGYRYSPYIGSDLWVPAPYTYGVGAAFSWSADAGWALGFGLGLAAGAVGPWWGPVGYWGWGAAAPAWGWGGYGGVASSNFYGHWGNAAFAGTRAAWANPYTGNVGAGSRGRFYNPVTGTSGIGARGGNFNAYTGNYAAGRAGAAYNPSTGVVKGGAHGVFGNAYNGNNVYADHDGNVFRASPSSGWQQRSSGGWQSLSSSDARSSLDRQSFSRGLGGQRWGNFNAGGWAGRFGGGGFADRGFGGFGGGAFRGRR